MRTKIPYLLILISISTLISFLYVVSNDGFGKGDILPFAFNTTILAAISLLLVNLFKKLFSQVNLILGLILSVVISVIQTFLFILLIWFVFGPWIGAFSFPIHLCWLPGISLANLFILIQSGNKFSIKHLGITVLIALILTSSAYAFKISKDALAQEQDFDIICLVHSPEENNTPIEKLSKYGLTKEERKAIKEIGIKGKLWTDKFFRISNSKLISTDFPSYDFDKMDDEPGAEIEFTFGNKLDSIPNKNPKVIIIMNHPMEESFEFKEPINSSLIAIQNVENDQWIIKRLGEETNLKKIEIKKTDFRSFPYFTSIILNLKNRGEFRLHGFQWLSK